MLTYDHEQGLLLKKNPQDHDAAKDMVAELMTQHRGEYILRIGSQPSQTNVFSPTLNDDADGWIGTERTEEEAVFLRDEILRTVDEVGGKVWTRRIRETMSVG